MLSNIFILKSLLLSVICFHLFIFEVKAFTDVDFKLSYYKDSSGSKQINEIVSESNNFKSLFTKSVNFGKDTSVYWIKVDLYHPKLYQDDYIIEIDYPGIDYIDYYSKVDNKWECVKTGSLRPFNNRLIDFETFAFPLKNQYSPKTLYFRIESGNALILDFKLYDQPAFLNYVMAIQLYYGFFIGIISLIILGNFLLYLFVSKRIHLIYVFYVTFNLVLNLLLSGHISKFFFKDFAGWYNVVYLQVLCVTILFSLWFLYEFLKLGNEKKFVKFFFVPSVIYISTLLVLCGFLEYNLINSLLEISTLVLMFMVLISAFQRYQKGNRAAGFYLGGYFCYFIFVLPVVLENYNLFPRSIVSKHGLEIGILLEVALLSVALFDKNRFEKKRISDERKMIYDENLKLQYQLHSKLEKQVKARTEELAAALEELNEKNEEIISQRDNIEIQKEKLVKLNNNKDKFISILAHDVKGPINSLYSFTEILSNNINILSKKELKILGEDLEKQTKNLFNLLENLLQWARSQMGTLDLNKDIIQINEQVKQTIKQTELMAVQKNIQIINYTKSDSVFGDKNLFDTVLRNLISNAIKFSESNKQIYVNSFVRDKEVVISVKDEGLGFTNEIKNKLFKIESKHSTPGTSGEKGTGLGLKLCKEFVEINGGEIWAESQLYGGSTFYFTIPLFEKNSNNPSIQNAN